MGSTMKTIALALLVAMPSVAFAQALSAPPAPPREADRSERKPSLKPRADAPLMAPPLVPHQAGWVFEATSAPVYTQWYFWTGIGATVATVITTVLISFEVSKPRPQLTEEQICGGACGGCIGFACK